MTTQPDPGQSAPPTPPPAAASPPAQQRSVFDAAKAIAQTLADFKKPDQERALRYAAEELGIQLAGPAVGSVTHHPLPPPPGGTTPPPPPAGRAQDIRTFVQAKLPKSDNQFAAVVAYFYRFEAPTEQRLQSINAETLQEATRRSGRDRLGNPGATLNNAVAQGYLDRAGRGEFTINTVGENLVAMTLPGGSEAGGSNSRARGSRKKVGKKVTKKVRRSSGS